MGVVISIKRRSSKCKPYTPSERAQEPVLRRPKKPPHTPKSFLKADHRSVVPSSLRRFIELTEESEIQLDFHSDKAVNIVTLGQDEVCFICNVYSTSTDIFTCRVCMKSFHEGCLQKFGDLSSEVSKLHANAIAKSSVGWSCYKCSNLSLLLTEDEMHEIIYLFDDYDANQDTQISLEEYIQYTEKHYKSKTEEELPEYLKTQAQDEFKIIDKDKTGLIDWWEFLNHESVKMLSKREKDDLVSILSSKEKADLKEKFRVLDLDNDGRITEFEAQKVFSDWFGKLSVTQDDRDVANSRKRRMNKKISNLTVMNIAQSSTMLVMEADADRNRYVDWDEFLQNEALYVIASRPNIPMPALMRDQKHSKDTKLESHREASP